MNVLSAEERETLYAVLDKLTVRAAEIFTGKEAWRALVQRHEADAGVDGDAHPKRRAGARR
jgi:hypothetical protein